MKERHSGAPRVPIMDPSAQASLWRRQCLAYMYCGSQIDSLQITKIILIM